MYVSVYKRINDFNFFISEITVKENDLYTKVRSVMDVTNVTQKRIEQTKPTMQQTQQVPKQKRNGQRAEDVVCVSTGLTNPFLTIAGFVNRNHSQYL